MKLLPILLALLFLLPGCNKYESENKHLKEELRMVREENNFLKAQIIGLKKEVEELVASVSKEKEAMEQKFQEERTRCRRRSRMSGKYYRKGWRRWRKRRAGQ